jgi:hypothetical protein
MDGGHIVKLHGVFFDFFGRPARSEIELLAGYFATPLSAVQRRPYRHFLRACLPYRRFSHHHARQP